MHYELNVDIKYPVARLEYFLCGIDQLLVLYGRDIKTS